VPLASSSAIGGLALQGGGDRQARPHGIVDFVGDTSDQPPECCEFFSFDQRVLGLPQVSQCGFGRIPGAADLLLVAFALADVDVGADPGIDGGG
jgi:hypothetical protein